MSQRLSIPKQEIIGHSVAGMPLYELRGFAPDDDGNDDGDNAEGEDGDEGGSGSGSEGGNDDGSGEDESGSDELVALKARMQAADRRAAAAEKRAKDLEDAALSETDRKDKEFKELVEYRSKAEQEIQGLKAQVSFLSNNDVKWQDPAIALSQLDLSGLKDDEGNVDPAALKRAIKKLATEKPFLVKTGTGGDAGGGTGGNSGGASGSGVGSGKKSKTGGGLSEEELRKRYPSLYS